ncbi:MAG TPA: short-chain dehydrogenase [Solibacterales bacterium]|nr:short-chain dehydrogenase [Bryobacterales bacterium]
MSLIGKTAIVTGASRGIGKAIAAAFVREGAAVALCGRKQETCDAVAKELGGRVLPVAAHVGRHEDLARLVETARREFGPIDILVNNAATNVQQGPALEATEAQFDKMVDVNLKSAFRLVQLVAPEMCARGAGAIVNVASVAGLRPQYQSLFYSMTKAALIMMTRSWALEFGPRNVRVNAIAPGLVKTVLSEYFWKDETRVEQFLRHQPIRRIAEPEEIAELAVLLAGDRCPYMTGEVLVADGGFLLA